MAFGTAKGPTRLELPLSGLVVGVDQRPGRGAARAHDDAGALAGDVGGLEPGIEDRLVHGDMVPGRAAAVEAHGAAIEQRRRIEGR
jgi:hypothetical protein